MQKYYVDTEEMRMVVSTFKKFIKEDNKISYFEKEWMSEDRRKQYERLKECIKLPGNKQLLVDELMDKEEKDNFTKVSHEELLHSLFADDNFIVLLSGVSLTNRILKACEKGNVPFELQYRLKQCAWIYKATC